MARLVLIRGLPGSGKSSLARMFVSYDDYWHREADMYFEDSLGNYTYDGSKIGAAHEWCQEQTRLALTADHDVVVSNTFTRISEMQPYLDMNYDSIQVLECHGSFGSEHGVPDRVVENMRSRWEQYRPERRSIINPN